MIARVKSLHIYPVKGTHAVNIAAADVGALGLSGDRRWMLIDDTGKFITQREYPQLAQIKVQLDSEGLILSAPGKTDLPVKTPGEHRVPVKIWGHEGEAYAAGQEANDWLSGFLGAPCRLVWQGDIPRPTSPKWSQPGDEVSFADGYPILITTTASLADLNARMDKALPMDRFRPNIVIECGEPWAEDTWKKIKIGEVELELVKPCTRCVVTTTDQTTGKKDGKEPIATLSQFRLVAEPGLTGVLFGQNAIARKTGVIHTGDEVTVIEVQPPPILKAPKHPAAG